MKRKIITLTLITLLTASLIGCGKKTDEVSTTEVSTTEVSTIESTIDETSTDEKTSTDESITDESSISTDSTNTVSDNNTAVSDNNTQSNDEIVDNNSSDNLIEVIPGVYGTLDEEASTDGKLIYTTDDGDIYLIDSKNQYYTLYTTSDEMDEQYEYTDESFTNIKFYSIKYKNVDMSDPNAVSYEQWYYNEDGTVREHVTEYTDGFFIKE